MRAVKAKWILNPIFLNVILWGMVYFLYKLPIINFYEDSSNSVSLFVFGVIGFFSLGGFAAFLFKKKSLLYKKATDPDKLKKFTNKLIYIWLVGFLIEIIYCGGFPALWILLKINKFYPDFGIQTIHGFLMALFYLSCLLTYWELFNAKDGKTIRKIIFHLIIPIAFISRASMLFTIIPLGILYLFYVRITLINTIRFLFGLVVTLMFFYYIGISRDGLDLIEDKKESFRIIMNEKVEDKEWLYPVVPIYLYVTASLNNINYNLQSLHPSYTFYYSTVGLFPTFIRNTLYDSKNTAYEDKYGLDLANNAFNTFTMYGGILKDFGIVGAFVYSFIFGYISMFFFVGTKANSTADLLSLIILFIPLLLSPFWDYLTSWVIIGQLVVLRRFGKRYFEV